MSGGDTYAFPLLLPCAFDDDAERVVLLLRVQESVLAVLAKAASIEALKTDEDSVRVILL